MRFIFKRYFYYLSFLFITMDSYAQLNFQQMATIKLGTTFNESKNEIMEMFAKKPTVMKSDFFGAYQINYENIPFSYYGNGNYSFQYAKDTLVSINIDFEFFAKDTAKFRRLYETLISDMNSSKSTRFLKQYSNLNSKEIFNFVKLHCVTTTWQNEKNYKPIKTKYFGQNFWAIYDNSNYTSKFFSVTVNLKEEHYSDYGYGKPTILYNGGVVDLKITLTNEKFQDLNYQVNNFDVSNYQSISDDEDQVSMNFENGVYTVPVKLNNVLSMNFVLDPGASDVSISPDVFMVLYKAGTITNDDFIGTQNYQFADGTTAKSDVFKLKIIKIGDKEIKDVKASISNSLNSPLLLGQSALKKLPGYRIDNNRKLLIFQ